MAKGEKGEAFVMVEYHPEKKSRYGDTAFEQSVRCTEMPRPLVM